MDIDATTRQAQAALVAATLVCASLLVFPFVVEPFMLPKATAVVLLSLVVLLLGVTRLLWRRSFSVPLSLPAVAVGLFTLAAIVSTTTSTSPWTSVVGFYGRYSGLATYLAYAVLFFAVLRLGDGRTVRLWTRAVIVTTAPVAVCGLLQAAGVDVFGFVDSGLPPAFATFGNINFAGAWAGMVVALLVSTAFDGGEARVWRGYAGVMMVVTAAYAVVTAASQALVVLAVSAGWAGLVLALTSPAVRGWVRTRRGLAAGSVGAALLAVAGLLLSLRGRMAASLDQALVERPDLWSAALAIWRDHPVLGTGLDTYAHHFLTYRPASHAVAYGTTTSDAPHSVPLAMLSNGGLVLAIPYLLVLVAVSVTLVRGVRGTPGEHRAAVAGWGGVWLGYQAQSLVSFDVPPLALLHWVSAGVIIAIAAPPRWRAVGLPGTAAARHMTSRGVPVGDFQVPASTRVGWGAAAIVTLVCAWFVVYPLRADFTAARAAPLTTQGRFAEAAQRFEQAARANPAEGSYLFLAGRSHEVAGDPAAARARAVEATERDPGTMEYPLFAARLSLGLGDVAAARRWYDRAVARDPNDPQVLKEAAGFLTGAGEDHAAARVLLARVLALDADDADARAALAALDG